MWSIGSATDAVADVGGLRRVDHRQDSGGHISSPGIDSIDMGPVTRGRTRCEPGSDCRAYRTQ